MKTKKVILFPKDIRLLAAVGENIKLARKRRKLSTTEVSERAGIHRTTLYKIEKGEASVSFGAYFNVLKVFGLEKDFLQLAANDEFGRKLTEIELLSPKKR